MLYSVFLAKRIPHLFLSVPMVDVIPRHPQVCHHPRQKLRQIVIIAYGVNCVSYCTWTMTNLVFNTSLHRWSMCSPESYTLTVLLLLPLLL